MGAFDGDAAAFCLLHCAVCHDMRDRAGKEDDEVSLTDLPLEIGRKLGENAPLTVELFTNIHVLTHHSVMAAYDNYLLHMITS